MRNLADTFITTAIKLMSSFCHGERFGKGDIRQPGRGPTKNAVRTPRSFVMSVEDDRWARFAAASKSSHQTRDYLVRVDEAVVSRVHQLTQPHESMDGHPR